MAGLALCSGCARYIGPAIPAYVPPPIPFYPFGTVVQQNPALIAVADRDLLWDALVDVVDDYFRVKREQRVRQVGDVLTEGRLDTFPKPSATFLEPFEHDVPTTYDRLEATLQSIRRYATVRVVPSNGGYLVEVVVTKELEDIPHPEVGFISKFDLRNDDSLRRLTQPVGGEEPTEGWILQGRDVLLEQEILRKLQARVAAICPPTY